MSFSELRWPFQLAESLKFARLLANDYISGAEIAHSLTEKQESYYCLMPSENTGRYVEKQTELGMAEDYFGIRSLPN